MDTVILTARTESQASDHTMQMIDSTIIRAHHHAAERRGGIHHNGIGRSHGGLTTKIHTRTHAHGLAIGFCLTTGQASDMTSYPDLIQDDLPTPAVMLADKGYDSDAIRLDLERRGVDPVIPAKAHRKRQRSICEKTYALRHGIERFFNKLTHSRRCATRYDTLANSFHFRTSFNSQPSGYG